MRKSSRRELREQRRKQEELDQLKNEIKQFFVERGEPREHIQNYDICDINGNMVGRDKPYFGAVGGQLFQLVLAIQAI